MHPIIVGLFVLAGVAVLMCFTGMCCRKNRQPAALIEPPDHKVA